MIETVELWDATGERVTHRKIKESDWQRIDALLRDVANADIWNPDEAQDQLIFLRDEALKIVGEDKACG
jgi:hypothetical protein